MAEERPPYYLERPDAPPPSFGAVAQSGILPEVRQAQSEYQEAQKRRAERVGARIAEEKQAITAVPHEAPPAAPTVAPPPSVGLTPFLAPVEGERPENTIAKLIQGVGLLAVGVAGRKDARASLAALTGALKGWQEGDKERADRHFADWQAQSETLLKNWQTKRTRWKDIMEDRSLTIQERARLWELDMLKEGVELDPLKASLEGAQYLQGLLDKQQAHADSVTLQRATLQKSYDLAGLKHDYDLELAALKRQGAIDAEQRILEQYTPEALSAMGQQWALTGKTPAMGYGKAGQLIKSKIVAAGLEWVKSQGIDPSQLPAVQAEVGASKAALTKLRGVNAVQMAAIRRFDGHADALLRLSDKVDRSGSPVVNRAILKARGEYQGDADVAAYETQAFELAMEFSRVVVGTAQGDAMTRDEARKNISAALNPAQLKAVVEQLRQNAHRNIETNRASEEALTSLVQSAGGFAKKPAETKALEPTAPGASEAKIPAGAHRDGNDIVSDSGKYVWRDGKWQAR